MTDWVIRNDDRPAPAVPTEASIVAHDILCNLLAPAMRFEDGRFVVDRSAVHLIAQRIEHHATARMAQNEMIDAERLRSMTGVDGTLEAIAVKLCRARGEHPEGTLNRCVDGAIEATSFLDLARRDVQFVTAQLFAHETGRMIGAAIARADLHATLSTRQLGVRFLAEHDGLRILARIASRNGSELDAQTDLGHVLVPWNELDARASDLVKIVDQCVCEVEEAVGYGAAI